MTDLVLRSADAREWAHAFCAMYSVSAQPNVDADTSDSVELMIGWFANAIETARHVDQRDRWKWLASTRELQQSHYGLNYSQLAFDALAEYFTVNFTALTCELVEFMDEVNWKPWMKDQRGHVPDRDAAIGELVDAAHFLGNLLCALDVTDEEWAELYQKKQERNRRRQESGSYTKAAYKCPDCARELDRPGAILEDTYAKLFLCAHCSAKVDVTHRCNHCGLIEPKMKVVDDVSHCDNCGHAL